MFLFIFPINICHMRPRTFTDKACQWIYWLCHMVPVLPLTVDCPVNAPSSDGLVDDSRPSDWLQRIGGGELGSGDIDLYGLVRSGLLHHYELAARIRQSHCDLQSLARSSP